MTTKSKSVFLTEPSMALFRKDDPFSGRVNQVFERYQSLLNAGRQEFGAVIKLADLKRLCEVWVPAEERQPLELEIAEMVMFAFKVSDECGATVQQMSPAAGVALLEQLELYRMRSPSPSATQSEERPA